MKHSYFFEWAIFVVGIISVSIAIVFDSLALAGFSNDVYSSIRLTFSLLGLVSFIALVSLKNIRN